MSLNKINLEKDGLVVGGTQLATHGGSVSVGNNIIVGANTYTSNLIVTGTFVYQQANTVLPTFSAFGSALTTTTSGVATPVLYDRVEYDTNNCFNPTNQWQYRNGIYTPPWSWAPNVPGYYLITAPVLFTANGTANAYGQTNIMRQNNALAYSTAPLNIGPSVTATTVVYMNGTSDYVNVMSIQNSTGALAVGSNAPFIRFRGCYLRPA
jgi:hypothetical protein